MEPITDFNETLKHCLEASGYNRNAPIEIRMQFDFRSATSCMHNIRERMYIEDNEATKQFLEENPYFRGTNWKWKETAEYTCKHIDTLQGSAVVCQKPYYVN